MARRILVARKQREAKRRLLAARALLLPQSVGDVIADSASRGSLFDGAATAS
jgi:hypothetical protein